MEVILNHCSMNLIANVLNVLCILGAILPNHAQLSDKNVEDNACVMLFVKTLEAGKGSAAPKTSSSSTVAASSQSSSNSTTSSPAARRRRTVEQLATQIHRLISPQVMLPLVEMGFSEDRAIKALLLNLLNTEMAMEWLLEHSEDPDIDEPLSRLQLYQIARSFGLLFIQPVPADIERAVADRLCTYTVTRDRYAPQQYHYCFTCNLIDGRGCCISCASVCHAGHNLSPAIHSDSFFCDCGSGDVPNPCQAMSRSDNATAAGEATEDSKLSDVGTTQTEGANKETAGECGDHNSCAGGRAGTESIRVMRMGARTRKGKWRVKVSNEEAGESSIAANSRNFFDFVNQRDFSCIVGDVSWVIRDLDIISAGGQCCHTQGSKNSHSHSHFHPHCQSHSHHQHSIQRGFGGQCMDNSGQADHNSPNAVGQMKTTDANCSADQGVECLCFVLASLAEPERQALRSVLTNVEQYISNSDHHNTDAANFPDAGMDVIINKLLVDESCPPTHLLEILTMLILHPKGADFFSRTISCRKLDIINMMRKLLCRAGGSSDALSWFLAFAVNLTCRAENACFPVDSYLQILECARQASGCGRKVSESSELGTVLELLLPYSDAGLLPFMGSL